VPWRRDDLDPRPVASQLTFMGDQTLQDQPGGERRHSGISGLEPPDEPPAGILCVRRTKEATLGAGLRLRFRDLADFEPAVARVRPKL
jgi:hypothetical protein